MHMFVPGTVENWDIIIDFNKMSTKKIPRNEMGKVLGMCGEHYRCRMAKTWLINTNTMINALYKMASVFLDSETKEKIKMTSKNSMDDMFENIHPSQIWKKYGGTADEPSVFWPPVVPSGEFGADLKSLVTEEEHNQLLEKYNSGPKPRLLKPSEMRGPGDYDFIPMAPFDSYLHELAKPREAPIPVHEVEEDEETAEAGIPIDDLLEEGLPEEEKEYRRESIVRESQRRKTTLKEESEIRTSIILRAEEERRKREIELEKIREEERKV